MTYTMLLNLTLKNATNEASTVRTMNTKCFQLTQNNTYAISLALAWLSGLPLAATCASYALAA